MEYKKGEAVRFEQHSPFQLTAPTTMICSQIVSGYGEP